MNIAGNYNVQNRIMENLNTENIQKSSEEFDVGKLSSGQTLTGKIVSMSDNSAVINVNGTNINARIDQNMSISEGQTVTFSVKGTSNDSLTLSPMYTNINNQAMAAKALSAANMPITEQSLSIVSRMMDEGLGIDKNSISDMVHASSNFPEADIKMLSEMNKFGLEINDNNIEKFSAFRNYENQITGGMDKIMDSVQNQYRDLIAQGNTQDANTFMSSVLKTFTGIASVDGGTEAVTNPNEVNAQTVEVGTPLKTMLSSQVQGFGDNGESLTREKMVISEEAVLLKGDMINQNVDEAARESGKINLQNQQLYEANVKQPLEQQKVTNLETETKLNDAWQNLNNTDKSSMIDILKQSGLAENEAKFLATDAATQSDFLEATRNLIEKGSTSDSLMDMVQSDKFGDLLKSQMQAQWLLSPIDVERKETVENLYHRLNNQLREMQESLETIGLKGGELSQNLDNMNQNLDFMDQMNQMMQYVQLPLKMNGSEATGDLFVYTDKKSLAEKNGSVSALLHLDMKNLGPLDVYASINDNNKVYTKFSLSDESLIDFIEDNIHILNERLEKRGYSINCEVTKADNSKASKGEAKSKPERANTPAGVPIAKVGFECLV